MIDPADTKKASVASTPKEIDWGAVLRAGETVAPMQDQAERVRQNLEYYETERARKAERQRVRSDKRMSPEDVLASIRREADRTRECEGFEPPDAITFLRTKLADDQRVPATEIIRQGSDAGFSKPTLLRAKAHLHGCSERIGGRHGYWVWFLPSPIDADSA